VGALSTSHFDATYVAPDNADIALIKAKTDNLPADPASNTEVDTRLATTGYTAPDNADILLIKAKTDNLPADPASNTEVNTRLATTGYTAPDNADILLIKAKTDNLPTDPASNTEVDTRLSTSHFDAVYVAPTEEVGALSTSHFDAVYVAPDNADILLIKAKTDTIPANPATNTEVDTRLAEADYVAPDNAGIAAIETAVNELITPSTHFTTDVITDIITGMPIAGANVYLLTTNDHTGTAISSDVTDATGTYKLYAPSAGTYYVLAEDTGYQRTITQVVIS
jgi:hypothetical protein